MTSYKLRESDILVTEIVSFEGKVEKCEFRVSHPSYNYLPHS
jgi:hypothetical protein